MRPTKSLIAHTPATQPGKHNRTCPGLGRATQREHRATFENRSSLGARRTLPCENSSRDTRQRNTPKTNPRKAKTPPPHARRGRERLLNIISVQTATPIARQSKCPLAHPHAHPHAQSDAHAHACPLCGQVRSGRPCAQSRRSPVLSFERGDLHASNRAIAQLIHTNIEPHACIDANRQ